MNDPYRKPGEKEPEPLPKKTPMYRKTWSWIQTIDWEKVLMRGLLGFVVLLLLGLVGFIGWNLHEYWIFRPAEHAKWIEQHRNTCTVVPRDNSAKFSLIIYDENANEFIQGFYDSRAEADTVRGSLPQCQK